MKKKRCSGGGCCGLSGRTSNVQENCLGVGCNNSYSEDAVLRERHGVELCLTTTGAEHVKGTVTAE